MLTPSRDLAHLMLMLALRQVLQLAPISDEEAEVGRLAKLGFEQNMPDMETRAMLAATCYFLARLDLEFSIQ